MIRVMLAAARFQVLLLRRNPADLLALATVPLFTLSLLSIMERAGRLDLVPFALIGSTVIAVWNMALNISGDLIDSDRWNGTFEAVVAAPVPLAVIVFGRTAAVTLVSLVSLVESVVVARVGFGVAVTVPHTGLFLLTIAVTAVAMAGTATAMAGTFVLARSARTFQNSLSYPFYLLSGAVVPPALLPGWLHPVTRVVFLSWSTDLVRDCLHDTPVPDAAARLGVIGLLGVTGYAGGWLILRHVLRRVRATGTVGFA